MPSNHPIPTIAALALSLYTSDRRLENLPRVTEYQPHEIVSITRSSCHFTAIDGRKLPAFTTYTEI